MCQTYSGDGQEWLAGKCPEAIGFANTDYFSENCSEGFSGKNGRTNIAYKIGFRGPIEGLKVNS